MMLTKQTLLDIKSCLILLSKIYLGFNTSINQIAIYLNKLKTCFF